VRDVIDVAELLDAVGGHGKGGTVMFFGTVRAGPEDGPVVAIEYSAYDEMAERECARIVGEALDRWPETTVALKNRMGRVPVGEASVGIAVAAPHRSEAFDACRYIIDEVKKRVPIWKREFLSDGGERWLENKETASEY